MLTISKPSADRLNLEFSGSLNADQMREALEQLIAQSEDTIHGKMLYTIGDFELPTMGAIAVELQLMPKLFSLMGKFDKCAVLSDASWIRTAAEIEGAVIPMLEVKSFPMSSAAEAEDWLEGKMADQSNDEDENFPV